jgi:hypothetical protein
METLTTRRALLGGMTLAPVALAISGNATGASSWSGLVARYQQARMIYDARGEAHAEVENAYFEQRPDRPSFVLEIEGDYGPLGKHVLPVSLTEEELNDPSKQWRDPERVAGMRADLAAYRDTDQALRGRLRYELSEAAEQKALADQTEALEALVAAPAPDLAALAEKVSILIKEYGDQDGGLDAILADVQRLARGARQ